MRIKAFFRRIIALLILRKTLAGDKSPNPKIVNKVDGCAFIKR